MKPQKQGKSTKICFSTFHTLNNRYENNIFTWGQTIQIKISRNVAKLDE